MRCVFYVLGEDDPLLELTLPFCPPRSLLLRYNGQFFSIEQMELRVEGEPGTLEERSHLVLWLTEQRRPMPT